MRIGSISIWGALLVALVSPGAQAAAVFLNTGGTTEIESVARDGRHSLVYDTRFPTGVPYSADPVAVEGGSRADSSYRLSNAGFRMDFDHHRAGDFSSIAQSSGRIFFSVDEDAPFETTGQYTRLGEGFSRYRLSARLADLTTGQTVFQYTYRSFGSTPTIDLVLGNVGSGSGLIAVIGQLNGILIAGRNYEFLFDSSVSHQGFDSQSGAGFLHFAIIPEPSVALLVLMGLAGLSNSRRRDLSTP